MCRVKRTSGMSAGISAARTTHLRRDLRDALTVFNTTRGRHLYISKSFVVSVAQDHDLNVTILGETDTEFVLARWKQVNKGSGRRCHRCDVSSITVQCSAAASERHFER